MTYRLPNHAPRFTALLMLLALAIWPATSTRAQAGDNLTKLKDRAAELIDKTRYTEALPLLERIVRAEPNNDWAHFHLGFALFGQANNTIEDQDRRLLRIRSRNAFIRSRELGNNEPLVHALIASMPADGSDGPPVSKNLGAHMAMVKAEALFSRGKFDDALKLYQSALALDPNLYEAALFSGDVYMQKGDFAKAEIWYQKAIAIDPRKETAYRYSATPLMKQGKHQQALERYIHAYITEPYNAFSISGITQWATVTNAQLAHPAIEIPTDVSFDDRGNAKVSLEPNSLTENDGSAAWIAYGATRAVWHKEKFSKTFPAETDYRHSLAEEAAALRSVISVAVADKKITKLNPAIATLKRLNEEGLLEAYILLARPDEGIVRDYPSYLNEHRDLLYRYVATHVVHPARK